ncbi:MAG TPA: DUF1326 domain-containing protein [Mycobacteriales bacterium]|nr:DUF1326 domain-containing protein [Mycobacteriales bacterium]
MSATATEQRTHYRLTGDGYEFCNCNPGCTCNFAGFPSSSDGSCQALVAGEIRSGFCGDTDLSGLKTATLIKWPKAIHDGNGAAVLVVEPECTDEQLGAIAQIYGGQLGGMPWEILAGTLTSVSVAKARITLKREGMDSRVDIDGIGSAAGRFLRNPVTNDPHEAHIVLPTGFIWKDGHCGIGEFQVSAEGLDLEFRDSNWIYYEFDWTNTG